MLEAVMVDQAEHRLQEAMKRQDHGLGTNPHLYLSNQHMSGLSSQYIDVSQQLKSMLSGKLRKQSS